MISTKGHIHTRTYIIKKLNILSIENCISNTLFYVFNLKKEK